MIRSMIALAALALVAASAPAQCVTGRCAVAPAAAPVSYGATTYAQAAVVVPQFLFVVPGVPTTQVTAPPAAAPAAPQYIPPAAATVVQRQLVQRQVVAAPVIVQHQVVQAPAAQLRLGRQRGRTVTTTRTVTRTR